MLPFKLILLLVLVNLISCDISKTGNVFTICKSTFTDLNNVAVNVDQYCKQKTCIAKCCPIGEIVSIAKKGTNCQKADSSVDYSKFYIYNNKISKGIVRSNKTLNDYNLVLSKRFDLNSNETCVDNPKNTRNDYKSLYIFEDGNLKRYMPNYYEVWVDDRGKLEYCIDIVKINKRTGPVFQPGYILLKSQDTVFNTEILSKFSVCSLLVSCFFLLLVLIVYSLLPQLRRIAGKVLMAYVSSLLATFMIKIIRELLSDVITFYHCRIITPFMYFTILSSFFWLNIMSFDTWWTFRGVRKQRDIHRRGETVKFLWYCLYAWGTPALMSTAYTIIDRADLSHWPSFAKPHLETCLVSKYETILYLYIPLFIIIVLNCILFIMTTYNIWIVERKLMSFNNNGTARNNNTNNRNRFRMYKTLSVIMGVNWVLEIIHTFSEDTKNIAFYISMDLYNSLIGVVIFFLFVFKKNILYMLCEKFNIKYHRLRKQSTTNNSKYSVSSKKGGTEKNNETTEMTTST